MGNHYSDFWRLNLDNGKWRLLSEKVLPSLRLPGLSRINNTFYVFGGRGGDERFFNSVWEYKGGDFNQLSINKTPESRYGHAQATNGQKIYVFGGFRKKDNSYKLFGDLWQFDPNQSRWTLLSRDGPSSRYGAALVSWEDKLVVFGGRYLEEEWWFSDDTWIYDLSDRVWTQLDSTTAPSPRYTAGVASTETKMYIYAGMTSRYEPINTPAVRRLNRFLTNLPIRNSIFPTFKPNVFFSDLWEFDRYDHSWRQISSNFGIPPLKTPLIGLNNTSLIVGFGNNLQEHYNVVWRITDFD